MTKTIVTRDGSFTISGTEEWLEIEYRASDMDNNDECGFMFNGEWHDLNDFPRIHDNPWMGQPANWMSEFHAIQHTSAFGGLLLKLADSGDCVQVFTF